MWDVCESNVCINMWCVGCLCNISMNDNMCIYVCMQVIACRMCACLCMSDVCMSMGCLRE